MDESLEIMDTPLARTPLHDTHTALGGKMVPFAGHAMPVQYPAGIRAEHAAVRTAAGLFDVSHMGEFTVRGPQAAEFVQYLTINDVNRVAVGQAQYSALCNERGTLLDDLLVYRFADRFMLVVNASNREKDWDWVTEHAAGYDVELSDDSGHIALVALQGPASERILTPLTSVALGAVGYYRFAEGEVALGALSLLTDQHVPSLFSTSDMQIVGGDMSEREGKPSRLDVADGTCDVVIMNPPFTRPTNHAIAHVPVPSFAGFNTSEDEQKAMSEKLKRSKRMLFGSGHAGLASNFMDLAHVKLKHGGVLALVLPFSFTSGASWKRARAALHEHYDRIRVIGIASSGQYSRAFSADTGMAECLVVATKNGGANPVYFASGSAANTAGGQ